MDTPGQRLKQVMKHYRQTQQSLGQSVGVTKGYVSVMMSGQEPISTKVLYGLIESFPQLNIHWLLTGHGEMLLGSESQPINKKSEELSEPELDYKADPERLLRAIISRIEALERWRLEVDGK